MLLAQAEAIAESIREKLQPYCERIEIAGSIRRRKPVVKDIELVAIPKKIEIPEGLFDTALIVHPEFCRIVNGLEKVKGEPTGKYTQRILPEGIKLDLFMANKDNWGLIYAIRTGSATFSHRVLARGWVKMGYKSIEGYLTMDGRRVAVPEETDLFRIVGIPYIDPEHRNIE